MGYSYLIDPCTGEEVSAGTPLYWLLAFSRKWRLHVTATTNGTHVPGSLHYQHRAIDVSLHGLPRQHVEQVIEAARANEFRVIDEDYTGQGPAGYSSGPHLHISNPPPGWTGGA